MRFLAYSEKDYVENLRQFLDIPKKDFLVKAGLRKPSSSVGRGAAYNKDAIIALEKAVNAKIALAEAPSATLAMRLDLVRSYRFWSDAEFGKVCGVSREGARRWLTGPSVPRDLRGVADALEVPLDWLESGVSSGLPADSYLGLRVGDELMTAREALYGQTVALLGNAPDDASMSYLQALIEMEVKRTPALARLARQAGGRWQSITAEGDLLFAPWDPLPDHGLSRRYWTDEVEAIIQEELTQQPSIYAAWHAIARRCEAKKLEYPQRITLHKRLDRERERAQMYGVDLNAMVAGSVALHATL